MRIDEIELLTLPDGEGWPVLIVAVRTDDGLTGIGEVGMRGREQAAAGLVADLRPLLVGVDASRIEHVWQLAYRSAFFPSDRHQASVLAGIDLALWDLRGQALGVPVHALFGGRSRDYVPCYAHVRSGPVEEVVQHADALAGEGWRHLRISVNDPAQPEFEPRRAVRATVTVMRELRAALGDDVELLVDVHTRLDLAEAVQLCRELEPVRPYFVEDPLPIEHVASYRTLRARTGVPLAAGEQFGTKWEFRAIVEQIDHARVDLAHTGLTEGRKIAALCEAYDVRMAFHNSIGPVCSAASTQLSTVIPNVSVQEQARRIAPPLGAFDSTLTVEPGKLRASDAPGLGITADLTQAVPLQTATIPRLHRPDGSVTNW